MTLSETDVRKAAQFRPGSVGVAALIDHGDQDYTPTKPGVYYGIPFEVYQSWSAINNGLLRHAARSLRHFQEQRTNPQWKQTPSQRRGVICHTAMLEPMIFRRNYAVMPDFADQVRRPDGTPYANPKATTEYKKLVERWERDNAGKQRIDADEWEMAMTLQSAINEQLTPEDRELLAGPSEVSIVWDDSDTGLRCKARIDKLCRARETIVDLKTTQDAMRFGSRDILHWGYDRQMAFYRDGMRAVMPCDWKAYLLAVEPERPYGMVGAPLAEAWLARGQRQYRQLLADIARAERSGEWPGYEQPEEWRMPDWVLRAETSWEPVELVIDGHVVEV